jgi:hypothetical protein
MSTGQAESNSSHISTTSATSTAYRPAYVVHGRVMRFVVSLLVLVRC